MVTRHKPSNEIRATTRAASDEDYRKLAQHITEAIINKCRDVVIRFPYFVQLPDDWPRGLLIKRDEKYNWYRVKCFKAADWLHERGYLPENARGIVKSMRSVNNMLGELDRMLASPQEEFLRNSKSSVDKLVEQE